jgi:SAM-dependent methyltransferase
MIDKDVCLQNERFWDDEATSNSPWSQPVSSEVIANARQGEWGIHITKQKLSREWLPQNIKGKDILCLASAGGQQAPVLAAAGANVTVFDISEQQLAKDQLVSQRDGLQLRTVQGNMTDLAAFGDASFDYIIHPISNLYIPDVNPVWSECYRVLRSGGELLSSFYNPILFVFERNKELEQKDLLKPVFKIPYSDLESLAPDAYQEKISTNQPVCFGHSLTDLINGQCQVGFSLIGFYEDEHPSPRFLIEKYMPTMIATRAKKGADE